MCLGQSGDSVTFGAMYHGFWYNVPMTIRHDVPVCECDACGHQWIAEANRPDRCPSRKCRSTRWGSQPATSLSQVLSEPAPKTLRDINALRAICSGELPGGPEPEQRMCQYTEYDTDTGETYHCRLPEHGPKTRHFRGAKRDVLD